jgi:type I restriction enzyme M protein
MNLLLHGLESPQIDPFNSLRYNPGEISVKKQVDIILSNPPLGGEEEKIIQDNFPPDKRTSQIPLLFLQLIMRLLKQQPKPGRAAVVTSNSVLLGNGVCARIKEELLKEFNLHTIVRLPSGVFTPYTSIPTVLLFFDRSKPTEEIWYYEILPPESRKNYTKTKPLQYEDFAECLAWWRQRQKNEHAWKVSVNDVLEYDQDGNLIAANLDIKNPNCGKDFEYLPPKHIVADILKKERQITKLAVEIEQILMEILPE